MAKKKVRRRFMLVDKHRAMDPRAKSIFQRGVQKLVDVCTTFGTEEARVEKAVQGMLLSMVYTCDKTEAFRTIHLHIRLHEHVLFEAMYHCDPARAKNQRETLSIVQHDLKGDWEYDLG